MNEAPPPVGKIGQFPDGPPQPPMTPAVPDPTVEALSEDEREALEAAAYEGETRGLGDGHPVFAAVERILAARATPDDLRDRLQALCDAAMRNKWHLGTEAVSLTVAQVLAVVGEGA